MPITFEFLWASKYGPLYAAYEAALGKRRAEDFIDLPRLVCGLPLRAMTPRDLLHLDYIESPFIRGGEIRAAHLPQFLYALHAAAPRWWWAEQAFFRHCAALDFEVALAEINVYCERIFADQEKAPEAAGGDAPPIGTHFLAPLIVRLASGLPSLTPAAIMDTPLPQLFQYEKILQAEERARDRKAKLKRPTALLRFRNDCLAEVNRLNAAEAAAVPDSPPPAAA